MSYAVSDAQMSVGDRSKMATFDRMKTKVRHAEAISRAKSELTSDNTEEKLAVLEKEDQIEKLLAEIKAKRVG